MGFIYFDSLSSPQLKGEKQSITGMEKVSRHHPIYFPTLLLLVSSTGLEIYRLFFFFSLLHLKIYIPSQFGHFS